jgi:Barstar (barnase inhibitor)
VTETGIPGPARSGVYRTPADFAPLRESFDEAHAQRIEVDLDAVRTKAQLLDVLARSASLPAHFGRNWDALADCFQDLPAPRAAYLVHVFRASAARSALVTDWAIFLEILEDAAIYWSERDATFLAFVDDAPELRAWR